MVKFTCNTITKRKKGFKYIGKLIISHMDYNVREKIIKFPTFRREVNDPDHKTIKFSFAYGINRDELLLSYYAYQSYL